VNIVYPAATAATDMLVPGKIAVEAGFLAAKVQFPDRPLPAEQVQVPVDGSQADLGKPLADNLIKVHGGGVRAGSLELFQDDPSLPGASLLPFLLHQ
jgi:hypothetical protein